MALLFAHKYLSMNFEGKPTFRFMRYKIVIILALVVLGTLMDTGCGGGSSSNSQLNSGPPTGNWQFTLQPPSDTSFEGLKNCAPPTNQQLQPLCMGGFFIQSNGSVTGQLTYAVSVSQNGGPPSVCNSGSASVSGSVNGSNVSIALGAGGQTFSFTGTMSSDGSSMSGTYTTTDGPLLSDGTTKCGTGQTGLQWSAVSVPPLSGPVQGSFHSQQNGGVLTDQDFAVTGYLNQSNNIGASNATITGTLNFQNYPCLTTASVNGEISGSSVVLQVFNAAGSNIGQIGAPFGLNSTVPAPVRYSTVLGGAALYGSNGYSITTKSCGSTYSFDSGNICLAVGNATACNVPVTLSSGPLTFAPQPLGSTPTTQSFTVTNTDPSGNTLTGMQISLNPLASEGGTPKFGASDFNLLPNFTETDNCAASEGALFSLAPQQSCTVNVSFSPQESCPWIPYPGSGNPQSLGGAAPELCPFPLTGTVTVSAPTASGDDTTKTFVLPVTGTGLSSLVPSVPELDFGAEANSETSPPQTVTFTNQGASSVQILPAIPLVPPVVCRAAGDLQPVPLVRPLISNAAPGLHIVVGGNGSTPSADPSNSNGSTVDYICDIDQPPPKGSGKPNFPIVSDNCSGMLIPPQGTCSVQIAYSPQPGTTQLAGLDYFLELNTLQCTNTTTTDCEIDAGRFPLELKANTPSPLRMTPGAGLDFGSQPLGQPSANPLTITLYNDPNDPNAGTVTFSGLFLVKGDYSETDDCQPILPSGSSCTINVTFKPKILGFDPGTISIAYPVNQIQTIYLRGSGQ